MVKIYPFVFFVLLTICFTEGLLAQKNAEDSALMKKYWNRVNIQSITSKGNNLYNGIDNYVQLVFPDKTSSTFKYILTSNNGEIYEYDETSFLALPKTNGWAFIAISIITENEDTLLIGKKRFPVINLPLPALKIGNTVISDQSDIDKNIFLSSDTLKVFFTDDIPECTTWYKIERFSIGYAYGKIYVSADNNGAVFKDEARTLVNKIRQGLEVNIKVHTVSPSGILKNLPLVKFKTH
jgi:hypothetical protein